MNPTRIDEGFHDFPKILKQFEAKNVFIRGSRWFLRCRSFWSARDIFLCRYTISVLPESKYIKNRSGCQGGNLKRTINIGKEKFCSMGEKLYFTRSSDWKIILFDLIY